MSEEIKICGGCGEYDYECRCPKSEPPVRVQRVVRRFRLHWKHGDVQEVTTENTGNSMEACAAAMNKAGIGGGAIRALDYWEEIAPN